MQKSNSTTLPFIFGLLVILFAGCGKDPAFRIIAQDPNEIPVYTYEVVKVYPHNSGAFTQGLLFSNGELFESTGLNGQSSLRKVDLTTGLTLKRVDVPDLYFAEGLTILGDQLYQLTWQSQKGFIYDLETFELEGEFAYEGEGWGLTTDGRWLILSDGTHRIRFLDPKSFDVHRTIEVMAGDKPIQRLNELEYIDGEIYANVWRTDVVVRVDPSDGKVTGVIDLAGLLPQQDRRPDTDVLNGIAYRGEKDRLFVTGKRWHKLFEVRLRKK